MAIIAECDCRCGYCRRCFTLECDRCGADVTEVMSVEQFDYQEQFCNECRAEENNEAA